MPLKETFINLFGFGRRTPEPQAALPVVTRLAPPMPVNGIHALDYGRRLNEMAKWRDAYNPLRGISPAVVTRHIENAERGAQAGWQWLLKWVFTEDAVCSALEERSTSALSAMEWDIVISDAATDGQKAMAEAQRAGLKAFYESLCGFRASIAEIGRARFYGCSFLEKTVHPSGRLELKPIKPYYFVRDGSHGAWSLNPSISDGVTVGERIDPRQWVIRTVDSPVGRRAARMFTIKNYGIKNWQGFVEVYGIPAIFGIMPEDIDDKTRDEFIEIIDRVISDARGALPGGTDIKTVEAKTTGNSPFKELADWCDSQVVISATHGLLTMLTAPGSGTLAGSAHQEAFDLLAAKEAVDVSEILQEQVDRPWMEENHPGEPILAYFRLAPQTKYDPSKVVEHVGKLKSAGYGVDLEQLKERSGYNIYVIGGPDDPDAKWKEEKALKIAGQQKQQDDGNPFPMMEEDDDEGDAPEPPKRVRNRFASDGAKPDGKFGDKAKRNVAKAMNEDYGGIRSMWQSLLEDVNNDRVAVDSDEYRERLDAINNAIDAIAGAEPGTLKLDEAMEEINAEGLFHGWTWRERTKGGNTNN